MKNRNINNGDNKVEEPRIKAGPALQAAHGFTLSSDTLSQNKKVHTRIPWDQPKT